MNRTLLAAAAALALAAAQPALAVSHNEGMTDPATPAGAAAFIARAETELAEAGVFANQAGWVRATYITADTQALEARASGAFNELATRYAREAARFDRVQGIDPVVARKLQMLKRKLVAPAPSRAGGAAEVATLTSRLDSAYSTGKFVHNGRTLTLNDAEDILKDSRDPAELKAVWEGWRTISPPMRADYAQLVTLSNEGARELNYADTGALWRSWYDMEPDAFAAETDGLWGQVRPFYQNLHCYVRARLNAKYGDAVQPRTGPIRADLTGNMWGQAWGNIYDVVAPTGGAGLGYDLETQLKAKGYDPLKMVKAGEGFYTSMGIRPLPASFYERSQITRPEGREVVCHASAWDIDDAEDVRIKMCTKVNADDFRTIHHELGHNVYQRAYMRQPYLFKDGANDGFHEAIGDFVALSITPEYLQRIGLIDQTPSAEGDIPFLLNQALDKIAFMPFGLLVDRWRWQVFSGETTPAEYNADWWALVDTYQGLKAPAARPADAFDPGAKYHVPGNTPYTRYFLAHIYQFQFHRAACKQAGWTGPLHRCTVYGNKQVGQRFNAMMEAGQSRPWQDSMAAFTGERTADASAVADYFAPLNVWLTRQNRGQRCGW